MTTTQTYTLERDGGIVSTHETLAEAGAAYEYHRQGARMAGGFSLDRVVDADGDDVTHEAVGRHYESLEL